MSSTYQPNKKAQKKNPTPKRQSSNTRRRRQPPFRRRFRLGVRRQPPAPASYGWVGTARANIFNRGGQAQIQSREIFPITYHEGSTLDFMLPFNPAQWIGTRTAQLASTFAAYRPTRLSINWFSSVGTTTQGTVSVGTSFAGTSLALVDRAQAAGVLPATNGGFITPLWRFQRVGVRLATSLRENNFPTNEIQADDIPFWILASFNGVTAEDNASLGYIVINAVFSMYNPTMGGNHPSAASSVRGMIAHTDESEEHPAASVLFIPTTAQISLPQAAVGDDYWFAPGQQLVDTDGEVMNRVLQPIHGEYRGIDAGHHMFQIDPQFATIAMVLITLIGKGANFISRAI